MMKAYGVLVVAAALATSCRAENCPAVQLYHLEEVIRADPDDTSKDKDVLAAKKQRIDASFDFVLSSLPDSVVGIGSYSDMGLKTLGEKDKSHCYLGVTNKMVKTLEDIQTATSSLALENGGDEKNSQLTALQVVALSKDLFTKDMKDSRGNVMPQVITLQTRSDFHIAGEVSGSGALPSEVEENPGDGSYDCDQLEGDTNVIDYPSVDQVATALKSTSTSLAVVCTPKVFDAWNTLATTLKTKDVNVEVRQCLEDETDSAAKMVEAVKALNIMGEDCGGGGSGGVSTEEPGSGSTETGDSAAVSLMTVSMKTIVVVVTLIVTYVMF